MKSRKILVIMTIGFAALTGILSAIRSCEDAAIVPLFLGGISFLGLVVSLVIGSLKEK